MMESRWSLTCFLSCLFHVFPVYHKIMKGIFISKLCFSYEFVIILYNRSCRRWNHVLGRFWKSRSCAKLLLACHFLAVCPCRIHKRWALRILQGHIAGKRQASNSFAQLRDFQKRPSTGFQRRQELLHSSLRNSPFADSSLIYTHGSAVRLNDSRQQPSTGFQRRQELIQSL